MKFMSDTESVMTVMMAATETDVWLDSAQLTFIKNRNQKAKRDTGE